MVRSPGADVQCGQAAAGDQVGTDIDPGALHDVHDTAGQARLGGHEGEGGRRQRHPAVSGLDDDGLRGRWREAARDHFSERQAPGQDVPGHSPAWCGSTDRAGQQRPGPQPAWR